TSAPPRGRWTTLRTPWGPSASARDAMTSSVTSRTGIAARSSRAARGEPARNAVVARTSSMAVPQSRASASSLGPSRRACGPLLRRRRRIAFSLEFDRLEITGVDLREFWRRLKTGVEVTVAGQAADKLLGVRDGFLRFFQERHLHDVAVVVVPQVIP